MLGLSESAEQATYLRTAKTRIGGFNALEQFFGIAASPLLTRNGQRIDAPARSQHQRCHDCRKGPPLPLAGARPAAGGCAGIGRESVLMGIADCVPRMLRSAERCAAGPGSMFSDGWVPAPRCTAKQRCTASGTRARTY